MYPLLINLFAEIQAHVGISLDIVEAVRVESEAATATATRIITDLSPSSSISDSALDTADTTNYNARLQDEVG